MQRELEDRAQQQIDHLHAKLSETNAAKDTLSGMHETKAVWERVDVMGSA